MANISSLIAKIRAARYGREVRGSIADGIEAINAESEQAVQGYQEAQQIAGQSNANAQSALTLFKQYQQILNESSLPMYSQIVEDALSGTTAAQLTHKLQTLEGKESELRSRLNSAESLLQSVNTRIVALESKQTEFKSFKATAVGLVRDIGSLGGTVVRYSRSSLQANNCMVVINLKLSFDNVAVSNNSGVVAIIPTEWAPENTVAGSIARAGLVTELDSSGNIKVFGAAPSSAATSNLVFAYRLRAAT